MDSNDFVLTVKQVRSALDGCVDTVGKNKEGHIVVRKGFFYTKGMDAEKFGQVVLAKLMREGIGAQLVDVDCIWKAFRGSASVAQGSHFKAVLQ